MYHRFHAPYDCRVEQVTYVSGDTWNVNPIALKRIERLFCKNERAIIRCRLPSGPLITLVPVAAILVASIRLHFVDVLLHLRYRGPNTIPCDATLRKGEEMGWFQHGSTMIAFAPPGVQLCAGLRQGERDPHGRAVALAAGQRVSRGRGHHRHHARHRPRDQPRAGARRANRRDAVPRRAGRQAVRDEIARQVPHAAIHVGAATWPVSPRCASAAADRAPRLHRRSGCSSTTPAW